MMNKFTVGHMKLHWNYI